MTEPESHTLAYLRRIDEKLDRLAGRMDGVESRLDRIQDELLVLNGIVLRPGRPGDGDHGTEGDARPARALAREAGGPGRGAGGRAERVNGASRHRLFAGLCRYDAANRWRCASPVPRVRPARAPRAC